MPKNNKPNGYDSDDNSYGYFSDSFQLTKTLSSAIINNERKKPFNHNTQPNNKFSNLLCGFYHNRDKISPFNYKDFNFMHKITLNNDRGFILRII